MATTDVNKSAPMAAAPLRYLPNGTVDWGNMWDTFCDLAQEGGPPHRGTLLGSPKLVDPESEGYRFAVKEIIRGIEAVSGATASAVEPGWIAVQCRSIEMAHWLSGAIAEENVAAHAEGRLLLVPVGDAFTLKGEIKSVITAVAKTTHYWQEHLPAEVKQTLVIQRLVQQVMTRITRWWSFLRRDAKLHTRRLPNT